TFLDYRKWRTIHGNAGIRRNKRARPRDGQLETRALYPALAAAYGGRASGDGALQSERTGGSRRGTAGRGFFEWDGAATNEGNGASSLEGAFCDGTIEFANCWCGICSDDAVLLRSARSANKRHACVRTALPSACRISGIENRRKTYLCGESGRDDGLL